MNPTAALPPVPDCSRFARAALVWCAIRLRKALARSTSRSGSRRRRRLSICCGEQLRVMRFSSLPLVCPGALRRRWTPLPRLDPLALHLAPARTFATFAIFAEIAVVELWPRRRVARALQLCGGSAQARDRDMRSRGRRAHRCHWPWHLKSPSPKATRVDRYVHQVIRSRAWGTQKKVYFFMLCTVPPG